MIERLQSKKNRIANMLKQRNGATIVFALVVFMIAAIISITIVNVAMANLSRAYSRGSKEQARLAVVSATKYLESNEAGLNTVLNAMTAAGEVWTVSIGGDSDANTALDTRIEWTDVSNMSSMTAKITSADYAVEIRLRYNSVTGKWNIEKLKKISG